MSNEIVETKKCKHCQTDIPKKAKVCPNCKKKQGGKLKWFVIGFFVLAAIGGMSEEETSSNNANITASVQESVAPTATPEIEYVICTVDELMGQLNTNALKAEKSYQNKYLEVTGRLSVIDSDGNYISLLPIDDEWAFIGIRCDIESEEQLNHVLELSVGDTVTVKMQCTSIGEIAGYSGEIIEFVE